MASSFFRQILIPLLSSQLYFDGFKPHASLLEESVLDTHQSVLPSDNLRALLAACSNTIRTADVIFTNWNKGNVTSSVESLIDIRLSYSKNLIYRLCLGKKFTFKKISIYKPGPTLKDKCFSQEMYRYARDIITTPWAILAAALQQLPSTEPYQYSICPNIRDSQTC